MNHEPSGPGSLPRVARGLSITLALTAAAALNWKLRVLDTTGGAIIKVGNLDLFVEHYPMAASGFAALREGALPLWNPYQLCGLPFFAVPHTALLYPGNFLYLFLDPALAIEATGVMHLAFGGLSMFALGRALDWNRTACFVAALTLIGSGDWTGLVNQATLHTAVTWGPATLLAVEGCLVGRRLAPLGLALVVLCQVLIGATEILLYHAYAAFLFGAFRSWGLTAARPLREIAANGARGGAGALLGVALGAIQLLPSLELVDHSVRAAASLSLGEAAFASFQPYLFGLDVLSVHDIAAVGLLPLIAIAIGPDARGVRGTWSFAVTLTALAIVMSFGGWLYELHFQTPLGRLFRKPIKFAHLYTLGASMLAGLAVMRLDGLRRTGSLRPVGVLLASALLAAAAILVLRAELDPMGTAATSALLAAFALLPQPALRVGLLASLVVVHGALLFSNSRPQLARPHQIQRRLATAPELMALRHEAGPDRIYLSPKLMRTPPWTPKQGSLAQLHVSTDYESLAPERYGAYFGRATGRKSRPLYAGFHELGPRPHWRLLDLTSTRFYAVRAGSPNARRLEDLRKIGGAHFVRQAGQTRIYRRDQALPRARIVPIARAVSDSPEILDALLAADFDPLTEVLIEATAEELAARVPSHQPPSTNPRVEWIEEAREHIDLRVHTASAGWLVLSDFHYPGWRAWVGDEETPILRANYLFRAVPVPAGESRVRFTYEPTHLRTGAAASVSAALALIALGLYDVRRPRRAFGRSP